MLTTMMVVDLSMLHTQGGEEDSDTSELVSSDIIIGDEVESGHSTPQPSVKVRIKA